MTEELVHFTRGTENQTALDVFMKILRDDQLLAGNGMIRGEAKCVCFTETPLIHVKRGEFRNQFGGQRYSEYGFVFSKATIYQLGGRPVIYQSDAEYTLLHPSQKYRHVKFDPNDGVDFTWEREWRLKIDALPLLHCSALIVPNSNVMEEVLDRYSIENVEYYPITEYGWNGYEEVMTPFPGELNHQIIPLNK